MQAAGLTACARHESIGQVSGPSLDCVPCPRSLRLRTLRVSARRVPVELRWLFTALVDHPQRYPPSAVWQKGEIGREKTRYELLVLAVDNASSTFPERTLKLSFSYAATLTTEFFGLPED